MSDARINSTIGRTPWPQTGATHHHVQLEPPDKDRAIKGLLVCYVVWLELMGWFF